MREIMWAWGSKMRMSLLLDRGDQGPELVGDRPSRGLPFVGEVAQAVRELDIRARLESYHPADRVADEDRLERGLAPLVLGQVDGGVRVVEHAGLEDVAVGHPHRVEDRGQRGRVGCGA